MFFFNLQDMPANRYVHIGYFQSCGLNVLNGFFFFLLKMAHTSNTHIHLKNKSQRKGKIPSQVIAKGQTAC